MLTIFCKKRIICLLLCALILALAVGSSALRGGALEGLPYGIPCSVTGQTAENAPLVLRFSEVSYAYPETAETASTAEKAETAVRIFDLFGEGSLREWGNGRTVALLLRVTLPEGWSLCDVVPLEDTAGLTVTVGRTERGFRILLDGVLSLSPENTDAPFGLLRMGVSAAESAADTDGTELRAEGDFYWIGEDGDICACPLATADLSTDSTDDMDKSDMDTSTEKATESPENARPEVPFETAADTDRMETDPPLSETECLPAEQQEGWEAVYAGCQETPPRNGTYSVRFLFCRGSAVVCVRGGGALTLTVSHSRVVSAAETAYPGDWTLCTFRGLRETGEYVFRVFSEGEEIEIRYGNGRFIQQKRRSP
jgi:hypothetical protein